MNGAERQRRLAKRAFQASAVVGIGAFVFFLVRGELVTGVVLGGLLVGGGFFEYRRRLSDLELADDGESEDPFERRERFR